MASELDTRSLTDLDSVHSTVHATALESFLDKHNLPKDTDPALLVAQAELASGKDKPDRTEREVELVRWLQAMTAVDNAVGKGLIATGNDAEVLTDAIVYGDINPKSAIKYLKVFGSSNLERALTPRELATAIAVSEDIGAEVSIATIARIADATGISLKEGLLDDADITMLLSSLDAYTGTVTYSGVEDDLVDGPVPTKHKKEVTGTTLLKRSSAGTNPAYSDEGSTGAGRVDDFAEMAGIDDYPDEVEALYDPVEDK